MLLAALLFYISVGHLVVVVLMFVFDPSIFFGLVILASAIIVSIYALIFKFNPNFRELVFNFWDKLPF